MLAPRARQPRLTWRCRTAARASRPGERKRIFERFAAGADERSQTGLGLAIVHENVSLHGGTVSVDSSPDGGALFVVTLPLDTSTPSQAVTLSQQVAAARQAKLVRPRARGHAGAAARSVRSAGGALRRRARRAFARIEAALGDDALLSRVADGQGRSSRRSRCSRRCSCSTTRSRPGFVAELAAATRRLALRRRAGRAGHRALAQPAPRRRPRRPHAARSRAQGRGPARARAAATGPPAAGTEPAPVAVLTPLRRGPLDRRDEPRADRVGLLGGRRLDHHAHERLGAARAHEHAPAALERRAPRARRASRDARGRPSRASRSATRTLTSRCGSFSIACAVGEVAAAERLEREQRGGDPVAGRARSPCR